MLEKYLKYVWTCFWMMKVSSTYESHSFDCILLFLWACSIICYDWRLWGTDWQSILNDRKFQLSLSGIKISSSGLKNISQEDLDKHLKTKGLSGWKLDSVGVWWSNKSTLDKTYLQFLWLCESFGSLVWIAWVMKIKLRKMISNK